MSRRRRARSGRELLQQRGPCEHGVKPRSKCKVCSACPHGRKRNQCKECGGASICEHGRRRTQCKECGGSSICEHGRRRSKCKECGGSGVCEHGRQRYRCKECGGAINLRARSYTLSARIAVGEYGARSSRVQGCGGREYASTVVGAVSARSAVDCKFPWEVGSGHAALRIGSDVAPPCLLRTFGHRAQHQQVPFLRRIRPRPRLRVHPR